MSNAKRIFIIMNNVCVYCVSGKNGHKYKQATAEQAKECIKKMRESGALVINEAEADFHEIYNQKEPV